MTEFILCLAAGCLLLWIIYLKRLADSLARNVDQLAGLLKRNRKDKTYDTELVREVAAWEQKRRERRRRPGGGENASPPAAR